MKQHKTERGFIVGLSAAILSVVVAIVLLVNRQYFVDQMTVWQYTPSSEIASFAERTSMNDTGKFYFYASQPSLEAAASFNEKCDRKEESTAILGCYNGQYIYIYNVNDATLDGIREVTAAHEMLHAAYVRMNEKDKSRVNALIEEEYAKLKANAEFSERMDFYARTEPGERDNELHSIIATEVASISPALEQHYKTYFSDRSKVVALHTRYAKIFSELQAKATKLSSELTELGDKIEAASFTYNKDIAAFNQDVDEFKQKIDNGEFTTQSQVNAARNSLLARADDLDARRTAINKDVALYNTRRAELAKIAAQSEALNRSIDSSLSPSPSL